MDKKLLDYLCCPFCGEEIVVRKVLKQKKTVLDYGVLTCAECNTLFPLVEGIPILLSLERKLGVVGSLGKGLFAKICSRGSDLAKRFA